MLPDVPTVMLLDCWFGETGQRTPAGGTRSVQGGDADPSPVLGADRLDARHGKSDPIAVFYTQETQPRPKDLDKTLVGSMALRAARRKTSVAKILSSTPELGRVRALRG